MPPQVVIVRRVDGSPVCERCVVADRPLARMRGLLGRAQLPLGDGLLLRPASSVHTAFMRFSIDVVFLDRQLTVLKVSAGLAPWRASSRLRAHAALELAEGEAARRGVEVGERLELSG